MVHIIAYLLFSYLAILILVWFLFFCFRTKTGRIIVTIIGIALLIAPALPYAIVERQTMSHRTQLKLPVTQALKETGFFPDMVELRSFKVLSISKTTARVYAIVLSKGSTPSQPIYEGIIISLKKIGGKWKYDDLWDCVWSDGGNADGNVFPPYLARGDYP